MFGIAVWSSPAPVDGSRDRRTAPRYLPAGGGSDPSSVPRRRVRTPVAALALMLWAACGGGGGGPTGPSNPGTPVGTYPLTVTGSVTSGSTTVTNTMALTLTVN